ncbi:MAG: hypothetical protein NZ528_10845 [Caldilineales bacterium]|nr:hypothetical protein [Caldilineales bacterium]MDW8317609.1 hypothetical protein [Anaerolineae bacterium]
MLSPASSNSALDEVRRSCALCDTVDSWTKLYLLMWFCDHPSQRPTAADLAERLCLGDTIACRQVLEALQRAGFLVEQGERWALSRTQEVQECLASLRSRFVDPLARQELIERIRRLQARGV